MSWGVRVLPLLAAAVVVTAAPVAAGVILSDPERPRPTRAEPLATPLASLDTTALTIRREPFCDRVAASDVAAVLGGEPGFTEAWSNGEPVAAGGATDVAHEYGCGWSGGAGERAAAWVFAPPVTAEAAAALVTGAAAEGCTPVAGAPPYGSPSVALTCPATTPGLTTVSFRGLFGDAWLVCEVTPPVGGDPVDRAGRWCAGVALAASTNQPAG